MVAQVVPAKPGDPADFRTPDQAVLNDVVTGNTVSVVWPVWPAV